MVALPVGFGYPWCSLINTEDSGMARLWRKKTMGTWLILILTFYIFIQCIDNLVAFVNLKHLEKVGDTVPAGFEGYVNKDELAKIRSYTVVKGKFGFLSDAVRIVLTLAVFFGPILNWYNSWMAGWELSPLLSGVLFFLVLTVADAIFRAPFDLYHTFVIEERFGFNTQTVGLWIGDFIKALLISAILYGILLGGAFWLIQAAPELWWFFTWVLFASFSIFLLFLSPYVIEPLFNKFTPLDDPDLEELLRSIVEKAGISVSKIFKMDASRRSRHGNAYFSGIGRVKRIVLFDTLLEKSQPEEVAGILAHEAGHWKMKHVLKRIVMIETVALVACFAAFHLTRGNELVALFGLDHSTMYAKLFICGFLLSLVGFIFGPLSNVWSRRHERQADAFAVSLTNDPGALATALVKLGRDNLANLHPHPWYAALHYSHPPLAERVADLHEMSEKK